KLRDQAHNCWGDCSENALEMQAAIEEWNDAIKDSGVDNTPKDNAIYTAETRTMEMEFMDSNNPLKSNSIKLNIEAALLQSPMTIARPPGAETYLWVPNNGQGTLGNTAANAGLAYMNFQVPVNGSYRIWGLVQGDTNNDNGFYVRVRDGNT